MAPSILCAQMAGVSQSWNFILRWVTGSEMAGDPTIVGRGIAKTELSGAAEPPGTRLWLKPAPSVSVQRGNEPSPP